MENLDWKKLLPWFIIVLLLIWIGSWLVIEDKKEVKQDEEKRIREDERKQLLNNIAKKEAFMDSLASMESQKEEQKQVLLSLQGELAAARDGLEQAKEWQLLRTQEEREAEISAATQRIQEAERAIRNAEISLSWYQTQTEAIQAEIERIQALIDRASSE
jgi:hypothetical protein